MSGNKGKYNTKYVWVLTDGMEDAFIKWGEITPKSKSVNNLIEEIRKEYADIVFEGIDSDFWFSDWLGKLWVAEVPKDYAFEPNLWKDSMKLHVIEIYSIGVEIEVKLRDIVNPLQISSQIKGL